MTNVVRQLRDFAFGAVIAILIATVAFVAVRNADLARRQTELATRAAQAAAEGRAVPDVRAVLVGPATPSKARPYVKTRELREDNGTWRPLVSGHHTDDKLVYDAANRYDRTLGASTPTTSRPTRSVDRPSAPPSGGAARSSGAGPSDGEPPTTHDTATRHDGALPPTTPPAVGPGGDRWAQTADGVLAVGFSEMLGDSSGRAIAVVPVHTSSKYQLAIAITPPAHPAPYPWLVIIGLLGLGAAVAAAGALGSTGAAARLGTTVGIAVLAIPCVLWGSTIAAILIVMVAVAIALAQRYDLTDRFVRGIREHRAAVGFLAPAAISMAVLVMAPFISGLVLGFYDHHHGTWSFVGLSNFGEILSGGGRPLEDPLNFWFILGVTVLWTVANVALHVTIGVAIALLMSRSWLRGKGVFRMLLILPWAVPNYITALIFKGMYTGEYGAINSILHALGLDSVSWFSSWATAFAANVTTNTWLGFPFMMVVAIGALESIPKDLYEAAAVDGASAWQRFRHITLPHLRPAMGPAVALGAIWTFNMFNVIYLVSAGQPGGSTNILVTDAYRWAFERGERYGMAAAYATIIFGILLLWNVIGSRILRPKETP